LTCFFNVCRLKISEKKKPSFNIITLCFFFINENNIDLKRIYIYFIFLLIGNLIFCEIISLNFCNLNRNTFDITAKRAKMENNSINESDNSIDSSISENIFEEKSF
jgi:hypothetical protein